MVHLHHRGQRALAEAGDRAHRELPVGRGKRQLVGIVGIALFLLAQPQVQAQFLQQIPGTAGVAGGPAADADHVVALRIEVEERKKGRGAIDPGRRNPGLVRDVAQRLHRQILVRVGGLNRLQDSQQRSGVALVRGDRLVDQHLFMSIQEFVGDTLHDSSPSSRFGRQLVRGVRFSSPRNGWPK